MKRILLLSLFACCFSLSGHAQIVNIPDAGFKACLIGNNVDTNADGEIQLSEAQAVTQLYALEGSTPIYSLEGMQSFTNATGFSISAHIATLDLTTMPQLQNVDIMNSPNLVTLNIAGMSSLKSIWIMQCPLLESFSFAGVSAMENINIQWMNDALTTMDLTDCTALHTVIARDLTSLNVSGCANLTSLDCESDKLVYLNVTGCVALQEIKGMHTHVADLDVSGLTNLQTIDITSANGDYIPTNVNASGCTALTTIQAMMGNIGTLNVSGCTALTSIQADVNRISEINLTGCTALQSVYLTGNYLTTLDATDCTSLAYLDISGNPLETLFIKNGIDEHTSLMTWPPIPFICADEGDIPGLLSQGLDLTQTICNSYCTFLPGGDYNTITGTVRLDMGNDGCDINDMVMPLVWVGYDNGTEQYTSYSNQQGEYTVYAHSGDFTMTAQPENPAYWNVSTSEPITFADNDHHNQVQDICITPNGSHPDIETVIVQLDPARPGFDAGYVVMVRNKGNQTVTGTVTFSYDENTMDFISSEPAADIQASGTIAWNYSGLQPFGVQYFVTTLNVNSPLETPSVNIDDVLIFTTSSGITGDEMPLDNTFQFNQTVVGSFDPNDKHCMQGEVVSTTQIGNFLHYVINFENTGNFPAENVVIKDLLDADKFDISSLQVLGASHTEMPVLTGNKLEFYFEGINLAPNAYGYVAYKIKTKPTLTAGSVVTNKASIYFDFNAPIETNTATTTFQQLGVPQYGVSSVRLFPNPVRSVLHVSSESPIRSVSVIDSQGRVVWSADNHEPSNASHDRDIDLQSLSSGVFFLRTVTDDGTHVDKIIKA